MSRKDQVRAVAVRRGLISVELVRDRVLRDSPGRNPPLH